MAHKIWMFLLAALLIAAAPACTDDEVGGPNSGTNAQEEPDAEVPQNSRLVHVNAGCSEVDPVCPVEVTFTSEKTLGVKLLDGDGLPVENARVRFDLDAGDATDTTITGANAQTDEEGIVEIAVRAGNTPGVASVVASVPSEETVSPIEFVVGVSSKENASYFVNLNHNGGASLGDIEVFLHPSDVTCQDVIDGRALEFDPNVPGGLTAEFVSGTQARPNGDIPVVTFANLPNGQAFTVEARALDRANGQVEAAFGCTDMTPAIESGMSVTVDVDLVDNLPRIAGVYDVTHTINIQDAICMKDANGDFNGGVLPTPVCIAIDLLGRVASDPASFIVGTGNGDLGLIGLILDFLPDNGTVGSLKNTIQDFLDNEFASGALRDLLNSQLQDWIDSAPPWVGNTTAVIADIYSTLQQLKVEGIIDINEEPVPNYDMATGSVIGLLEADMQGNYPAEQIWDAVIVEWSLPCGPNDPPSCSTRRIGSELIGSGQEQIVEGGFEAEMLPLEEGGYGLSIREHTLSFNFGLLLLRIIENVILPSLFQDSPRSPVNTFDKALNELIILAVGGDDGCAELGNRVANQVGGGSTVQGITEDLCDGLVNSASEALRDLLVDNLYFEGDDYFLIASPAGSPCTMTGPESYAAGWPGEPFPYSKFMGSEDLQCEWDITIDLDGPDEQGNLIEADATFFGERD